MKKPKQKWWIFEERQGLPWFHSCYRAGLSYELIRATGHGPRHYAGDYENGLQRLIMGAGEWQEAGQKYLGTILKDPRILERALQDIERAAKAQFRFNRLLVSTDPHTVTRTRLVRLLTQYHDLNHELWKVGMVPNLLELEQQLLTEYLRDVCQKRYPRLSVRQFQELITPTTLTYAQKQEMDLVEIAVLAGRHDPTVERRLRLHYKRFQWVEYGWTGPAVSIAAFRSRLETLLAKKNPRKELQRIQRYHATLASHHTQLERKLALDAKHLFLLRLLRRIFADKPYRMDALFQGYWAVHPFLGLAAKHLHLALAQLYMMYASDLPLALRTGRVNVEKLNEARRYSAWILEGETFRFFVGEEARKKMRLVNDGLPPVKATRELTGEVAYPGKILGLAKIVPSASEMYKVDHGDILISHGTDPSFLPAMKKAGAFVTDSGGLTCHAAIIARELKKPCIVGTRTATKVFRDGDRVEVDATKGVIQKI